MYFVDREKIDNTLIYMEKCLSLFKEHSSWEGPIEQLALERIAHSLIEAIIDVGNSMIDGFIMRDPGSYEDIIHILEDEKVLGGELAESIREVIKYRKPLVQSYIALNHQELLAVLTKNKEGLTEFPEAVRTYLHNELGPVSAFIPKNDQK